jgi:predicted HTH transcriptional regulator
MPNQSSHNNDKNISNNTNNNILMKSHILKRIREVGNVTTTSEIASCFKISWNTAEKKLLELALDNKITKLKKAGVNLWMLKE